MKDGGPAFPHLHDSCQRVNETEHWSGMSLRQWYAGKAMQTLILQFTTFNKNEIARMAYEQADAMISEGEKE